MTNNELECIEEIKNIVDKNKISVDIFLSGSVSRKEERTCNDVVISDVDLVIVVKNLEDKSKIKKCIEAVKESYTNNVNISTIYCMFNYFIKSGLADYVLSIDLKNPIVKKIDFDYYDFKGEKLHEDRWIFQMQSVIFYYCKYMVSKKEVFLCKSFQSLLRTNAYHDGLVEKNDYILIKEIEKCINDEEVLSMFSQSRNCVMNMIEMDENISKKMQKIVVDGIESIYTLNDKDKMEAMLGSLKCFNKLMNKYGSMTFKEEEYYMLMKEVMKENLGIGDISIIDYD
jgi:predicted nucleotidyltransferase